MQVDFYHYPSFRSLTNEEVSIIADRSYDAVSMPMHVPVLATQESKVEQYLNSQNGIEAALSFKDELIEDEEVGVGMCIEHGLFRAILEPEVVPEPELFLGDKLDVFRDGHAPNFEPTFAARNILKNV